MIQEDNNNTMLRISDIAAQGQRHCHPDKHITTALHLTTKRPEAALPP
jgi:hypothetical protein